METNNILTKWYTITKTLQLRGDGKTIEPILIMSRNALRPLYDYIIKSFIYSFSL